MYAIEVSDIWPRARQKLTPSNGSKKYAAILSARLEVSTSLPNLLCPATLGFARLLFGPVLGKPVSVTAQGFPHFPDTALQPLIVCEPWLVVRTSAPVHQGCD
jgi:hypothetical protein